LSQISHIVCVMICSFSLPIYLTLSSHSFPPSLLISSSLFHSSVLYSLLSTPLTSSLPFLSSFTTTNNVSYLFLSVPFLLHNDEQITGSTWKSVSVSALQGSAIQFHALTVLTEAVAYLSAINGVIVKTGTSHC
jgi:hypothetical protein